MLTKDQERKMIADLVNKTPPGYLKDFLVEAAPLWLDAINSDLCEIGLHGLWRQKMAAKEEIAELTRRKTALDGQIRTLQAELTAQQAKAQAHAEAVKNAVSALDTGVSRLYGIAYGKAK